MNKLIGVSVFFLGFATSTFADYAPFDHNIQCKSTDDRTSSVTVIYDKKEFPDLGRPGGIHLEINTGISELSRMGVALGIKKPYQRLLRRQGPAGQVGNSIAQDKKDPFVVEVRTGFTTYDLIGEDGKVENSFHSFISHLWLTRISEFGFHDKSVADSQEFIELRLLDDYGTHHMRFKPSDCKIIE